MPSSELLGYLPLTCAHASLSTPCLRVSSAVIKYHDLGRKGFVSLLLLRDSPSSEGISPGTQGTNLEERTEAKDMEEHYLLACSLWLAPPAFL